MNENNNEEDVIKIEIDENLSESDKQELTEALEISEGNLVIEEATPLQKLVNNTHRMGKKYLVHLGVIKNKNGKGEEVHSHCWRDVTAKVAFLKWKEKYPNVNKKTWDAA